LLSRVVSHVRKVLVPNALPRRLEIGRGNCSCSVPRGSARVVPRGSAYLIPRGSGWVRVATTMVGVPRRSRKGVCLREGRLGVWLL